MISNLFYATTFVVVLLGCLAFGGENSSSVTLDLVFFSLPQMPVFVFALGALSIGMIIGLLPSLVLVPYLRLKMSAMQNRIEALEVRPGE